MTGSTLPQQPVQPVRRILGFLFVAAVAAVLWGAASIPFVYESTSMWYRFGLDRILLRTGQILGLLAACLLLLQLVFSARLAPLEHLFSPASLAGVHRKNALILTCLALFHPFFTLAPDGLAAISIEKKYWPEMVGALLLSLLLFITVTAKWRTALRIAFARWRLMHRIATTLAVIILPIHLFFVSDTFEKYDLPRNAAFTAICLYALLWLRVRLKKFF